MNLLLMNHNTISKDHLVLTIYSLITQTIKIRFGTIFVYNNSTEICTDFIIDLINTAIIEYDRIIILNTSNTKTLTGDLKYISKQIYKSQEKILILKMDYSLSYTSLEFIQNITDQTFLFSLPTVNSKESVTDSEIIEYLLNDKFVINDHQTFYRGSDLYEPINEIGMYENELCEQIKYISWGGSLDFNVHVMTQNLMEYFSQEDEQISWGGCSAFHRMNNNKIKIIKSHDCFALHKYHGVLSVNNSQERNDNRKNVFGHRY